MYRHAERMYRHAGDWTVTASKWAVTRAALRRHTEEMDRVYRHALLMTTDAFEAVKTRTDGPICVSCALQRQPCGFQRRRLRSARPGRRQSAPRSDRPDRRR